MPPEDDDVNILINQKVKSNGFDSPFHPKQYFAFALIATTTTVLILKIVQTKAIISILALITTIPVVYLAYKVMVRNLATEPNPASELYCMVCKIHVSPSSLHCKYCNKCIDRLDHHCDYLGTCVSQLNYAFYFSLLVIFLVYLILTIISCLEYSFFLILVFLLIPVISYISYLFFLHLILIYLKMTTLEYFRERREGKITYLIWRAAKVHPSEVL